MFPAIGAEAYKDKNQFLPSCFFYFEVVTIMANLSFMFDIGRDN